MMQSKRGQSYLISMIVYCVVFMIVLTVLFHYDLALSPKYRQQYPEIKAAVKRKDVNKDTTYSNSQTTTLGTNSSEKYLKIKDALRRNDTHKDLTKSKSYVQTTTLATNNREQNTEIKVLVRRNDTDKARTTQSKSHLQTTTLATKDRELSKVEVGKNNEKDIKSSTLQFQTTTTVTAVVRNVTYSKQTKNITSKSHDSVGEKSVSSVQRPVTVNKTRTCSEDRKQSFPYLSGIYTRPPLEINFKRNKFVYEIEVSFHQWIVTVWSKAEYCHAVGWIGKTKETSRQFVVNLSKPTRIPIYVVDKSVAKPSKGKAQYTLLLTRRPRGQNGAFTGNVSHNVCLMRQECDRLIYPKEPCGLQAMGNDSWKTVQTRNIKLPECESGDEPGGWLVPCSKCSDDNSCYWKQAVWQPNKCSHHEPLLSNAQQSFSGKNILFLGDSTLRGMMYYLMEYLNGSLTEWEKSHTSLLYHNNLNKGRTNISFLYYPGIYNKDPISIALKKLVNMSHPIRNSSSTVLVVGRFKSLDKNDFPPLMSTLKQLGLTGIKLVMKTMGGNKCKAIEKDVKINAELTKTARRNGFDILQVFPIIMGRHKDFTYGSCALHYHFIDNIKEGRKIEAYHVNGDIVGPYSKILINMLHKHWRKSR